MPKLTDTQLIVLSKAAQREEGAAVVPDRINRAAAEKVSASLIARNLMHEVHAMPGMPVWRTDERDQPMSLVITKEGRHAIGIEDEPAAAPASSEDNHTDVEPGPSDEPWRSGLPRKGSKRALVIAMLEADSGATIDALIAATGWLPHTTRAALTGLRKRGYAIERSGEKGHPSIYRIIGEGARSNPGSAMGP